MYRPPAFREDRLEVLHAFIRAHPLAMLVTAGEGGLVANPIPFLIDPDGAEKGLLRAHLAKANGQLAALRAGGEAMVLFQGPDAYVTPSWYATKREHGKVVPTWNYATVHAWGTPRVIDDESWLRGQIGDLTDAQEQHRSHPWAVEDAPADFVASQIKGIAGLEIPIARIEGKWKVSQNRAASDRQGVVDGLRQQTADGGAMADLVEECGDLGKGG
ncbi:transcriptional regulator [Kaistia algarum]|uniref:FMN-binding negative transcriptional regulator n=1 Tax=Kaistia algarum TaxID=2083279 RepID=UPI000CE72FB1|nr:FMN-binding negative transcriptional regulator [Kaistia algarum]MCX5514601.1 FMN-binding negative transcriptional regulator [Kaistia algarum]PPE78957.1 transcriptional regulator [Kaistia algarum]